MIGGGATSQDQNKTRVTYEECGGGDGSVVTPPPHGYNTPDSSAKYMGGRLWQRGSGDICGVLPTSTEVGGFLSRYVPGKGEQIRESQRILHVSAIEVKCLNHT